MIEITKNERFHMYNAAIEQINRGNKRSICTSLRQVIFALKKENVKVQDIEKHFPELNERLPLPSNADDKLRINVLIECIKSLSDEKMKI